MSIRNLLAKTLNWSSWNQLILSFAFLAVIFTSSYYVLSAKQPKSPIPVVILSSNNTISCALSLRQSDNWFCETDIDWKRRKELHHIQDRRNRISDVRSLFFQNNWEPTIQCEFERRLGNTGDGGKWVCDVHRFEQNNTSNLLIYSFGSSGDFSFELAMKQRLPQAEIHTFDSGVYQCPANICTFHQARLGGGRDGISKSLRTIIKELNHQNREIHILKVDIEGGEFDLFEDLFDPTIKTQQGMPSIRLILFEIHLGGDRSEAPCRRTHQLFEAFRANYFAIYHKEANLYDPQNVFEYALLRLNPEFFNREI